MYIPDHFAQTDLDELVRLVRDFNFGTLITLHDDTPYASHLPFLISTDAAGDIILRGHLARANPHWKMFGEGESLAVFQGPHCYISPTWYETPGVPTWNYAAVHLMGSPQVVDDRQGLYDIVIQLTEKHEAANPEPWIPDFPDNMLTAIVGFSMTVTRIEGKYKLSQNRPAQDRSRVAQALKTPFGKEADENQTLVAAMMRSAEEHVQ